MFARNDDGVQATISTDSGPQLLKVPAFHSLPAPKHKWPLFE